jgi:hypothetical protein
MPNQLTNRYAVLGTLKKMAKMQRTRWGKIYRNRGKGKE